VYDGQDMRHVWGEGKYIHFWWVNVEKSDLIIDRKILNHT
jgi:hypothetical protein